eukprot:scaffold98_cov248-Ochromonas_danica.AAC.3
MSSSSLSSSHKGQRLRKYSLEYKVKTINEFHRYFEKGNASAYARLKGIHEPTFLRWLQEFKANRIPQSIDDLLRYNSGSTGQPVYRIRHNQQYAEVEEEFVNFIKTETTAVLPWWMMKDKALEIYDRLFPLDQRDPKQPKFTASDGWLSKVLKRHHIVGVPLHGEENNDTNQADATPAEDHNDDDDEDVDNRKELISTSVISKEAAGDGNTTSSSKEEVGNGEKRNHQQVVAHNEEVGNIDNEPRCVDPPKKKRSSCRRQQ